MSQDKQEINNEGIQERQERKETSVQRRRREKTPTPFIPKEHTT